VSLIENAPTLHKIDQTFISYPDEDKWKTETKTEGGAIQEYLISYQNLIPTTTYTFRVIAFNKYGISLPAKSGDAVSHKFRHLYFISIDQ
jgi:hypothetical protein